MTQKIDPNKWISQAEAAKLRGVSRQAINELVRKDRFETLEIGGRKLVRREEVVNYEPKKGGRPSSNGDSEEKESNG